jgi:hypothetical protein
MGAFAPLLIMLWWLLVLVVSGSFAVAVFVDAAAVQRNRGYTTLVSPISWSLAVLPFGVLAVLAYWLVHHSSLKPSQPELERS